MPAAFTYDYAVVRVVPRVERGEFVNAGVIVSCAATNFLQARIELDEARLLALDAHADLHGIRAALAALPLICAGGEAAGARWAGCRRASGSTGWCRRAAAACKPRRCTADAATISTRNSSA